MRALRHIAWSLLAALAAAAQAEIRYTVTAAPDLNSLRFEIVAPVKEATTTFVIPNFAPGHYVLLDQARKVTDVMAKGPDGLAVNAEPVDANTWRVATPRAGTVTFSYKMPLTPNANAVLMQGPYYYMYVAGRKEEPCRVQFVGSGSTRFAVSLDPARRPNEYTAPDYDVLADCPVTIGEFLEDTYTVRGKPHRIVYYGAAKANAERSKFVAVCKRTTEVCADFFGDLPYKRYLWHLGINSGGGGGGLEHLNSTNITTGARVTAGTVGLFVHEFFHVWNVKRIRSKPLGPFDYQVLPKTGALWWLEGVTDYYAALLSIRGGMWTWDEFANDLIGNLNSVRRRPQRFDVSIYDSSFRVGEANNGRGNSAGFGQNYYNSGWIAGMCLDAELRSRTGGKVSLDDVMRDLYKLCRDGKPGFEEDEIRKQLVEAGGSEMGAVYDAWIMAPGELPVEAQLAKLGYKIDDFRARMVVLGFNAVAGDDARGVRAVAVRAPAEGHVASDDVVTAIGGVSLAGETPAARLAAWNRATASLQPDRDVEIALLRGGQPLTVRLVPGSREEARQRLEAIDFGNRQVLAARKGWAEMLRPWLREGRD